MTFIIAILVIIVGSLTGIGALILVGKILNKIRQVVKSDLVIVLLTPVMLLLVYAPILGIIVFVFNQID